MKIVDKMLVKYAKRERGATLNFAYPPGGADIHRLCQTIKDLEGIVQMAQHELDRHKDAEAQNRIASVLFQINHE